MQELLMLKLEHYTKYRYKRCLPNGPRGLCVTGTTDMSYLAKEPWCMYRSCC